MIKINNLAFAYDNKFIFEGLNLNIDEAECVGLIGENGAGKSTLLKLLLGLIHPSKGSIRVHDILVEQKRLKALHQVMGYTFQNSDHQLFMPTVYDEVAFALRNRKMNENNLNDLVLAALKSVAGENLMTRPPYRLSGGEKRRVALATVLAMAPEVLIFDEPSIGLDPKARRAFIDIIQTLDKTKLIATHDLDLAYECCDKIILIREGKIVAQGKPEEILRDQKLLTTNGLELPLKFQ